MKTILLNRLKKWMIFSLIGCVAYFLGYIVGHMNLKPQPPATPSSLVAPINTGK